MPHKHPEDRVYTVISGVFYIGLGEEFDADKLQAYPPGAVIVLPGNTAHFHWAKSSEYVTQITGIAIFSITFPGCAFTVISLMPSSLPTCLFNLPETTKVMTSRSRGVSNL